MIHKPIQIKNLELSFPHKTCFENFNFQIPYGSRIAIIGRKFSGKSMLLRVFEPSDGVINMPDDSVCGYVLQVIEDHTNLVLPAFLWVRGCWGICLNSPSWCKVGSGG